MVKRETILGKTAGLLLAGAILSHSAFAGTPVPRTPEAQFQFDAMSAGATPATPNGYQAAFDAIWSTEINKSVTYRGFNLNNAIRPNNLTSVQGMWMSTATKFISENEGFLGGKSNRGFKPKILAAVVQVMTERSIPITPEGILLLPPTRGTELRVIDGQFTERHAGGISSGLRVFLTNSAGEQLGPDLRRHGPEAIRGANGETIFTDSSRDDYVNYFNLGSILTSKFMRVSQPNASSADVIDPTTGAEAALSDCFAQVAAIDLEAVFSTDPTQSGPAQAQIKAAAQCFRDFGSSELAVGLETLKQSAITALRGFIVGAGVGSVVPGVGTLTGGVMAASGNILVVLYNTYFKKEKITPPMLRNLHDFFEANTYTPTYSGEVLPRHGRWMMGDGDAVVRLGSVVRDYDTGAKVLVTMTRDGARLKAAQPLQIMNGLGVRSVKRPAAPVPPTGGTNSVAVTHQFK